MSLTIESCPLEGLLLIKPSVFGDARGYFFESYREDIFGRYGVDATFVQDNQSLSHKNILRGLHFQNPPHAQGKLVRVIQGAALDVAVDIRSGSPTYGKYFKTELNDQNHFMLWIPPGFAHGFLSLADHTIFYYKCTRYYSRESESGLRWNDPDLNINWGISNPLVSEKDAALPLWKGLKTYF